MIREFKFGQPQLSVKVRGKYYGISFENPRFPSQATKKDAEHTAYEIERKGYRAAVVVPFILILANGEKKKVWLCYDRKLKVKKVK